MLERLVRNSFDFISINFKYFGFDFNEREQHENSKRENSWRQKQHIETKSSRKYLRIASFRTFCISFSLHGSFL